MTVPDAIFGLRYRNANVDDQQTRERGMKVSAWTAIGAIALSATPALADTAPAGAAKTTSTSFDRLLADGYEIKAVTVFADTLLKEAYTNPNAPTQIVVTLQKGTSLATCGVSGSSWVNLTDATLASEGLCAKH